MISVSSVPFLPLYSTCPSSEFRLLLTVLFLEDMDGLEKHLLLAASCYNTQQIENMKTDSYILSDAMEYCSKQTLIYRLVISYAVSLLITSNSPAQLEYSTAVSVNADQSCTTISIFSSIAGELSHSVASDDSEDRAHAIKRPVQKWCQPSSWHVL